VFLSLECLEKLIRRIAPASADDLPPAASPA
jgi:hypothetical protein